MAHIIWFWWIRTEIPDFNYFGKLCASPNTHLFVPKLKSCAILPIFYRPSKNVPSFMSYLKMEHQLDYWLNLIIDFFAVDLIKAHEPDEKCPTRLQWCIAKWYNNFGLSVLMFIHLKSRMQASGHLNAIISPSTRI